MKVKDLYKKYKGYDILLFGRPLEKQTIPFTFLPLDKRERDNMDVKDIKVEDDPFDAPRFGFPDLKYKGTDHYKGHVYVYCVKPDDSNKSLTESLNKHLKESNSMSEEDELAYLKELVGDYSKSLSLRTDERYENGKLVRRSKVGDVIEPDRPVRVAGDYKIYARHFHSALPYTHYYIANVTNGRVFEIPEVITEWNSGVLKELTTNIKAGYNVSKRELEEKYKNYDFDPLDWKDI